MKVWEEWQKRALVAERENERLRSVLQEIAELEVGAECWAIKAQKALEKQ